jgi:hypothetical protein
MSATCPTCGQAVQSELPLPRVTITDPDHQGEFLVTLWEGSTAKNQKERGTRDGAEAVANHWRQNLPKAQRDLCVIDVQVDWDDYCDRCWQHYDHKEGYCRECNPSGAIA